MCAESRFDIRSRDDRIGRYFRKYLDRFVFVEFADAFIGRTPAGELMRGIPMPLRKEEVQGFANGAGADMTVIAENMTRVMGCDPHFEYTENYAAVLRAMFGDDVHKTMTEEGRAAASRGEMDNACIHFRAALCVDQDSVEAMYGYARSCRAMYLASENEEYTGRFKAEALDWFEILTLSHPQFPEGYYYLGYAYLNMGLYKKAELTWRTFVKMAPAGKDREEIEERLSQMTEPLMIEAGCNSVIAGKYDAGAEQLEAFLGSRFDKWWPLHYYLGVAYEMTGRREEAVRELKEALKLNGSNLEIMEELLAIYEDEDDESNIEKYSRKIEMVRLAMDEEKQASMEEIRREDEELMRGEPKPLDPEIIQIK